MSHASASATEVEHSRRSQVLEIKWNEKGRFDLIISDGANRCRSVLAPKHTQQIREGKIIQNSVVELTGYIIMKAQSHDGHFVVMIKELSVVQLQCVQIGSPSPLPDFVGGAFGPTLDGAL